MLSLDMGTLGGPGDRVQAISLPVPRCDLFARSLTHRCDAAVLVRHHLAGFLERVEEGRGGSARGLRGRRGVRKHAEGGRRSAEQAVREIHVSSVGLRS